MRVFNCGFIVLFMAMLLLPLVFVDLSSDRISVIENRRLANHPPVSDIKNHPGHLFGVLTNGLKTVLVSGNG